MIDLNDIEFIESTAGEDMTSQVTALEMKRRGIGIVRYINGVVMYFTYCSGEFVRLDVKESE